MSSTTLHRLTADEYLATERLAEGRSEFVDGVVRPMASSNHNHSMVLGGAMVALHQALRPLSQFVFAVNMRIETPYGMMAYPDVCVPARNSRYRDHEKDVLLTPELILEVYSPETERYDRSLRFERYQSIESLQTYLLVSQESAAVDLFSRQPDGSWELTSYTAGTIEIPVPKCQIEMSDIYERVFENATSQPPPP